MGDGLIYRGMFAAVAVGILLMVLIGGVLLNLRVKGGECRDYYRGLEWVRRKV